MSSRVNWILLIETLSNGSINIILFISYVCMYGFTVLTEVAIDCEIATFRFVCKMLIKEKQKALSHSSP